MDTEDLFDKPCYLCFEKASQTCGMCNVAYCKGCESTHKKWKTVFHHRRPNLQSFLHQKNLEVFKRVATWTTPVPSTTLFTSLSLLAYQSQQSDVLFAEEATIDFNSPSAEIAMDNSVSTAEASTKRTRSRSTNKKTKNKPSSGNPKRSSRRKPRQPRKRKKEPARQSSVSKLK